MKFFKILLVSIALAVLAACSGGGGSAGTIAGQTLSQTTPGGSTTTNTITNTVTVPTIAVAINNSSNAVVTNIAVGGAFVVKAKLLDASGAPVVSKLVSFSVKGSIATLGVATALTGSDGVAQVSITPQTVSSVGADSVVASATVNGVSVTNQTDFAVSASSLTLSPIAAGSTSLASAGNTALSTTALIGGVPAAGIPVNVSFSTSCGKINNLAATGANGVSVATNGSGVASATYDAVNSDNSLCSGPVTITANSAGATPVTLSINVAAPTANAIAFISADPAKIFVAGSGALEQTLVKFKVFAGNGSPLQGVSVTLSFVANPGGVGIGASGSTLPVAATSNAAGEVQTTIFSGTIPGPVKVRATLATAATIFAETQNLTVASGPPSQKFMSAGVSTFNIEGWAVDGTSTKITVRIADRQGNPVEDGTVINFTTEAGQVATSCATARVNGISLCSVDFISQNPRPAGGRVSVLAYLAGTKDYVDNNLNNIFDLGDTLINIGDAYRDDNENGVYETGEFVIPRGGSAACAAAPEPFPSAANTCDAELATTVRQQVVILYSSSQPFITAPIYSTSTVQGTLPSGSVTTTVSYDEVSTAIGSADNPLLPMPAATTVTLEAAGGTCTVEKQFGSPVTNIEPTSNPDTNLRTEFKAFLKNCTSRNSLLFRIKAPSGLETIFSYKLP